MLCSSVCLCAAYSQLHHQARTKIRCPNTPGEHKLTLVFKSRFYLASDVLVPLTFTVDQEDDGHSDDGTVHHIA
jgi:hypothetical protein